MDVLDSLKTQWSIQQGDSKHSLLDEYGVSLASWLLANLDDQVDVENVISSHLIGNDALLDHCGWEIIPLLYRQHWMQSSLVRRRLFDLVPTRTFLSISNPSSKIIDELFERIPPREVLLHTITAYDSLEEPWKAESLQRLLKLLPRFLSLNSKRPIQDLVCLLAKSFPIRHVTPSSASSISQGSIYGLENAEDTSESGQMVSDSYKNSLSLFIPPLLASLEQLVVSHRNTILGQSSARNILLSGLFLMAHSVASFRLPPDDSNASHAAPLAPPMLEAPHRPRIRPDTDLLFLNEAGIRIAKLVRLLDFSSLDLLCNWNVASSYRIRTGSVDYMDDLSTKIEVPEVSQEAGKFDACGVASCLSSELVENDDLPLPWLILTPHFLLELLLQHARVLFTSRCLFAPSFLHRLLLHFHPLQFSYRIDYPISYILETRILPCHIPHKAYSTIRACTEFAIRMPDTGLRQASLSVISGLVHLFDVESQYKLLYLLLKTCPYPTAQGIFVHLMKEAFLRRVSESSPSTTDPATSVFFTKDLFQDFLANTLLHVSGLEQRYDAVSAGLNFLRAILLRDSKAKLCAIWKPDVKSQFNREIIQPLEMAVLQIIAQHQSDDSYDDRKRIQKELAQKGMGDMSVEQLAQTQSQTILNWQLTHSLIQRIEELLS